MYSNPGGAPQGYFTFREITEENKFVTQKTQS